MRAPSHIPELFFPFCLHRTQCTNMLSQKKVLIETNLLRLNDVRQSGEYLLSCAVAARCGAAATMASAGRGRDESSDPVKPTSARSGSSASGIASKSRSSPFHAETRDIHVDSAWYSVHPNFLKLAILTSWFNLSSSNRAELQRSEARSILPNLTYHYLAPCRLPRLVKVTWASLR